MKHLILFILTILFIGCGDTVTKTADTNTYLSSEKIGNLPKSAGIQKIKVDSVYYIVVLSINGGVAIIKHQ